MKRERALFLVAMILAAIFTYFVKSPSKPIPTGKLQGFTGCLDPFSIDVTVSKDGITTVTGRVVECEK